MTALGIRNNNPGNIDGSSIKWLGQTGVNGRFATFDTPIHGIRALARNLLSYQNLHNLHTVRGIINRWAPPVENVTSSYISDVAGQMGVGEDTLIDLSDPSVLSSLCAAIIHHENGSQPYPPSTLSAGVAEALSA